MHALDIGFGGLVAFFGPFPLKVSTRILYLIPVRRGGGMVCDNQKYMFTCSTAPYSQKKQHLLDNQKYMLTCSTAL